MSKQDYTFCLGKQDNKGIEILIRQCVQLQCYVCDGVCLL
jgi:hypothetical protein